MKDRKLLNIELGRMTPEEYKSKPESGIVVVLDNVRSAHNVGSAFRSADAFGADLCVLCGITALPPSVEIHKSGLGAEDSVPWIHFDDTLEAVKYLRARGYVIASVEQTLNAVELQHYHNPGKVAFVFGNEVDGVRQDVVDASDLSLVIPQFGTKHSLNVSVTVGVVLWQAVSDPAPYTPSR